MIYAWSLFIEPLEAEFGWLRSQTSTIFTISVATVSLGMIVAGALEARFGHRIITFAAAAMIVFGFIASAFCHSLIETSATCRTRLLAHAPPHGACSMNGKVDRWVLSRAVFVDGLCVLVEKD